MYSTGNGKTLWLSYGRVQFFKIIEMEKLIIGLISIIRSKVTGKPLYKCPNCKTKNFFSEPYSHNLGIGNIAGFCKNCDHPIWD